VPERGEVLQGSCCQEHTQRAPTRQAARPRGRALRPRPYLQGAGERHPPAPSG